MQRIMVTGASGQIGSELVPELRRRYGAESVLATDLRPLPEDVAEGGPARRVDCTVREEVQEAVDAHGADCVFHLAAVLSAAAEDDPPRAYRVNLDSLFNVLEVAREGECAVFTPSSIAAFGPQTPQNPTPQDTIQRPTTIYGVTKVAGELLCDYYARRYGLDTRGVRYPGIVSYVTPPGGGTTDYAVEIFHHALSRGSYTCFLRPDTRLDLMYMPDALRAAIELMEADPGHLEHRNAFNVTAMQVTPEELSEAIRRHLPDFEIAYEVDSRRQAIADSWPRRLEDRAARVEWGWEPEYDLARMTEDMLENLSERLDEPLEVG